MTFLLLAGSGVPLFIASLVIKVIPFLFTTSAVSHFLSRVFHAALERGFNRGRRKEGVHVVCQLW